MATNDIINPEAIVFGLFETGLGVIRSLGRAGINVIGIDYKRDVAWYSRFVKPFECPHPLTKERDFIDWIKEKFFDSRYKRPIFLTSDPFILVFAKYSDLMSKYFLLNIPDNETLIRISNKYQQFLLAQKAEINVPKTWLIRNKKDFDGIADEIDYPVFLKGCDVNSWRKSISSTIKGYKLNNDTDLKEVVLPIIEKEVPIILQEIIKGPDSNHFKYCCYISKSGKTLAEFTLQKIRQNPIRFGIGSVVKSVFYPDLIDRGRKLMKAINYSGVGSVEFKLDEIDGKLKLIEINPRYWQQNLLTYYCGLNFAYINYLDLVERDVDVKRSYRCDVLWVNMFSDFSSFLSYYRLKELSLLKWLKTLKGPKVYSTFDILDPLPILSEINWGLRLFKIPFCFLKTKKKR